MMFELKIAISVGSRNSLRAPIKGSPRMIMYPKPCFSMSDLARFAGASEIIMLGMRVFDSFSLAFVGPGRDVLGDISMSKSGANSKSFGSASSMSSTLIFEPVVMVRVFMSWRSASSSRRSSKTREDAMLPHLNIPIFVVCC